LLDRFRDGKEVSGRTGQSIKLADHHRISLPELVEEALELRPGTDGARYFLLQ
jgi:hypothetical protein